MSKDAPIRLFCQIHGVVQGVGFRPFVYRLARECALRGHVLNNAAGVCIEAEASRPVLESFIQRLRDEAPATARISSLEFSFHQPAGLEEFRIVHSDDAGPVLLTVPADIAMCRDCLSEIQDPAERRFAYPFTNCTQCGPRFTIMTGIPYDRVNTSMQGFLLCDACRREYQDPRDRRFHAQPLACGHCGPQLSFRARDGSCIDTDDPLQRAVDELRNGALLALKGLGGFHIMADAYNVAALEKLRRIKTRQYKPFAVMFPDMDSVKRQCIVTGAEELLLTGPEAPIVVLERRPESDLPDEIAPGNPGIGCMLPYTPLHFLMLARFKNPLVATSGNLADEPICTDEHDAVHRLSFADSFLVHDRPIVRHADDSVARVVDGQVMMLRRARGYAPLPFASERRLPRILATGGDLKNVIAISSENSVVMSQHIGDLESAEACDAFEHVIEDFKTLYAWVPDCIATDMHPSYFSREYALTLSRAAALPLVEVQHHHAHMAACMFENGLEGDVLAVTWDGTGYGTDGTVWGGEFLLGSYAGFERVAHLAPFGLAGADAAVREPRRSALGVLAETGQGGYESPCLRNMFSADELHVMSAMLASGMHAVQTTSAGRLFDAVSAITGLCTGSTFEGQAAMMLEHAAGGALDNAYPFEMRRNGGVCVLDWKPAIARIVREKDAVQAARSFHAMLVEMIRAVARTVGCTRVLLSGGVFQNALLLGRARRALQDDGFEVYSHQRIPTNDGGIALGQIIVAAHQAVGA